MLRPLPPAAPLPPPPYRSGLLNHQLAHGTQMQPPHSPSFSLPFPLLSTWSLTLSTWHPMLDLTPPPPPPPPPPDSRRWHFSSALSYHHTPLTCQHLISVSGTQQQQHSPMHAHSSTHYLTVPCRMCPACPSASSSPHTH
ncbi:protein enabled homolog [Schistocerca nitens]|uniref:protein enabled homolog n=1 Tax=Schistocerca nitens TaxID=7011 RepID=UPI0021195EFE|nr:protein enabled homolog [Schistocerca nitens]